jgi:hypothetical protein
MCRGGESWKKQTTVSRIKGVCSDRLPHLRGDFTTCTNSCIQPHGHRPEAPHRCADGHEWLLDEAGSDLRKAEDIHANPDEKGKDDVSNRARS